MEVLLRESMQTFYGDLGSIAQSSVKLIQYFTDEKSIEQLLNFILDTDNSKLRDFSTRVFYALFHNHHHFSTSTCERYIQKIISHSKKLTSCFGLLEFLYSECNGELQFMPTINKLQKFT